MTTVEDTAVDPAATTEYEVVGAALNYAKVEPLRGATGMQLRDKSGDLKFVEVAQIALMGAKVRLNEYQAHNFLAEGLIQVPGATMLANDPAAKPKPTAFSRPMGGMTEGPGEETEAPGPGGISAERQAAVEKARRDLEAELKPVEFEAKDPDAEDEEDPTTAEWVESGPTIKAVLAYVEQNPEELSEAIAGEKAGKNRPTLLAQLDNLSEDDESTEEDDTDE